MKKSLFVFHVLALGCLLSACAQPLGAAPENSTPTETIVENLSSTPINNLLPEPNSRANQAVTPLPPLKITFPTPGAEPKSIWRPALYDVPFALGPFDHFYFSRPIPVDQVNWPLADYKYGDFYPGRDIVHTGVDIDAPTGTEVMAAAPGKIVWAGYGFSLGDEDPEDPYGRAVAIKHDFGYHGRQMTTVYAHLDRVDVMVGQEVNMGDILGIVGTTGATSGPHLHFEVRVEDTQRYYSTRNPELWLAPPIGWGVIAGKILKPDGAPLIGQVVTVENIDTGKVYSSRTYAPNLPIADDYYKENLVIADLPAGEYYLIVDFDNNRNKTIISVFPGSISFFTFRGERGFNFSPPPTPSPKNWLGN